jgi:hypothetical protein
MKAGNDVEKFTGKIVSLSVSGFGRNSAMLGISVKPLLGESETFVVKSQPPQPKCRFRNPWDPVIPPEPDVTGVWEPQVFAAYASLFSIAYKYGFPVQVTYTKESDGKWVHNVVVPPEKEPMKRVRPRRARRPKDMA